MIGRRIFIKGLLGAAVGSAVPGMGIYDLHAAPMTSKDSEGFPVPLRKPQKTQSQDRRQPSRIIVLDAGHGGKDPGAIGIKGTREKDVNIDIVLEMARILDQMPGVTVKLTRKSDIFLPLKERVVRAREAKADLFLSLHADSAPSRSARGLSAYTLSSKASNRFAAALAAQENLADGDYLDSDASDDVMAILADLVSRHTRNASLFAQSSLVDGVGRDVRLFDTPVQSANFAVLKAPDVPSVLIETGFLSNPKDEAILRDRSARRRIASALAREVAAVMRTAPFS